MLSKLRRVLVAGLITLIPVATTAYILIVTFRFVDGLMGRTVERLLGYPIPGLGVIATFLLVLLVGVLATNLLGKRLLRGGERLMLRVPLARTVYVTVKQIVDTVTRQDNPFKRVVLIEYPRKGVRALGFLTGTTGGEVQGIIAAEVLNVFVPTTPNPTSGFLLLMRREDVILLDMPVEDGIRLIISGGILTPNGAGGPTAPGGGRAPAAPAGGAGGGVVTADAGANAVDREGSAGGQGRGGGRG